MKRQLKIVGTMIAIVIAICLYLYALTNYETIMLWILLGIVGVVGLFIFYAGVSSFFKD